MTDKNDKWYSWNSAIGVGIFLACLGLFFYFASYNPLNFSIINGTSIIINQQNNVILNILAVLIGTFIAFLLSILWNDHLFNLNENDRENKIIKAFKWI